MGATRRSKVSQAGATGSEESSSAGPTRPLAAALSSDQPHMVAMAHLSVTRTSRDPADHKTSGEADAEARPGMDAMRSRTPTDDRFSTGADPVASLAMSTRASGTPADDRDSTEADPAASLGMTVVSKITSAHQASTETGRGASSAISTSAISEEPHGEPAMVETFTP